MLRKLLKRPQASEGLDAAATTFNAPSTTLIPPLARAASPPRGSLAFFGAYGQVVRAASPIAKRSQYGHIAPFRSFLSACSVERASTVQWSVVMDLLRSATSLPIQSTAKREWRDDISSCLFTASRYRERVLRLQQLSRPTSMAVQHRATPPLGSIPCNTPRPTAHNWEQWRGYGDCQKGTLTGQFVAQIG